MIKSSLKLRFSVKKGPSFIENMLMDTLVNSKDPYGMSQNTAFHRACTDFFVKYNKF